MIKVIFMVHVTSNNGQKIQAVKNVTGLDVWGHTLETGVEQPVKISKTSLDYLQSILPSKPLTIYSAETICRKRVDMLKGQIGEDKIIFSIENGIRVSGLEFDQLPEALRENKPLREKLIHRDSQGIFYIAEDYVCCTLYKGKDLSIQQLGKCSCIFPFSAFLEAARQEGNFATTTVGSILGRTENMDPKNPHISLPCYNEAKKILPPKDRSFYLEQVITSVWNLNQTLIKTL